MKRHITSIISQQFGKFASKEFPFWSQRAINKAYVKVMGLDMREFESPGEYRSLNALFTRHLRHPREIPADVDAFISPCDALITECGTLESTQALQIKGMQYDVKGLLGDEVSPENKQRLEGGEYINLYLSPKDYHRYHIPTDLKVLQAIHIPGKLYPVNIPSLKKVADLFIENERVVLECETSGQRLFYMVLVGALNVGKMQLSFEPRIQTDSDVTQIQSYQYDDLSLKRGDDFGCFEMGSTIVIISEPGMLSLSVAKDEKVRFSRTIAHLKK